MKREKFDIFSVLWTILLHALAIVLLLVLHLNKPVAQAESGVPVMLGNMGNLDTDYEFTEVNSMPAPAPAAVPVPVAPQAEPAITQNLEETVAIESGEKEKPVKPVETPKQPTPEEIQAQREREVQEQTESKVTDVFARSRNMQASSATENNSGEAEAPGSPDGNVTQGKLSGEGSYGTWDLGGRDPIGGLYKPKYDIQEEGRVVITITVDPEGNVIETRINNRTNTTNLQLRNAAIEAARLTKFEKGKDDNNQTGTITYYFKLR